MTGPRGRQSPFPSPEHFYTKVAKNMQASLNYRNSGSVLVKRFDRSIKM